MPTKSKSSTHSHHGRSFSRLQHVHGASGAAASAPVVQPSKAAPPLSKPLSSSAFSRPSWSPYAESPFRKYRFVILILVLGAVGVFGILFTTDFLTPTDCGSDAQCFVQLANNCAPAKMTARISTVSMMLSTKGCTLTKQVESLASEEPEPIRQFLVGKAMQCAFVQGGFDRDYVTTITGNLGTCSGDLRNAIEAILAA
jgi:hypothetical protein